MPNRLRAITLVSAVACFLAAALLVLHAGLPQRAEFTVFSLDGGAVVAPETGAIAPPIDNTPTLAGDPIAWDALRGQPVIVNFWATWCVPCRVEMPELQALYDEVGAENLHILAVNLDEPPDRVAAWVQAFGLTYTILLDDGTIARRYAFRDPPSTFVIAPDGEIDRVIFGPVTAATLRDMIGPYIE